MERPARARAPQQVRGVRGDPVAHERKQYVVPHYGAEAADERNDNGVAHERQLAQYRQRGRGRRHRGKEHAREKDYKQRVATCVRDQRFNRAVVHDCPRRAQGERDDACVLPDMSAGPTHQPSISLLAGAAVPVVVGLACFGIRFCLVYETILVVGRRINGIELECLRASIDDVVPGARRHGY